MLAENQITRFVKLTTLVTSYIDESRQTSKEFRRLWALAFRGLNDLGLDVTWTPKQTLLKVNPNLTVDLPIDYIDWVRVGMFNASGELATLKVNEQLSSYKDKSSARLSSLTSEIEANITNPDTPFWYGYWGDDDYEHYFGVGSGLIQPGECKVDAQNMVIILNTDFQYSNVLVEYISSPIMDDDYSVDLKAQEAMIAWLRWKDIQSLPSTRLVNLGEKRDRENQYKIQKRLARKRLKPFRLQVAEQYSRESEKLAVKA